MPTTSIQCDYLPKASLSSIQIDFKHEHRWTRDEAYDRPGLTRSRPCVCASDITHTTNALSTCAKSAPRSSPPQHARTHIRRGSAPYMYITRLGAHLSASSYSVVESQKHAQVLPDHTQSPTVHVVSCGAGCRGWHGQDLCHPRERTIRPDRSRASIIRGRRMKLQQ